MPVLCMVPCVSMRSVPVSWTPVPEIQADRQLVLAIGLRAAPAMTLLIGQRLEIARGRA